MTHTLIDTGAGYVDTTQGRFWVERRGEGPDVLLLGGLTDPVESWEPQLAGLSDRYRVTAFDNRGAGRTPLPEDAPLSLEMMADDAAAVLDALEIPAAHVAGFSGGSQIAQLLALRHPGRARSVVLQSTWTGQDPYFRSAIDYFRWLPDAAPSERAMLEAFFLWVYTPRAHNDGTVGQIIEEALAYPHPQSAEEFVAQLDAFTGYDTYDELPDISAPTLVLAGEVDIMAPPRLGRVVAERIPGAKFEIQPGEAHQPFQEVPDEWNARVDAFWREVGG